MQQSPSISSAGIDHAKAVRALEKAVLRSGSVGLVKQAIVFEQDTFTCDVLSGAAPQLSRNMRPDTGKSNRPLYQVGAIQLKESGWIVAQLPAEEKTKDASEAYEQALVETAQRYLFDDEEVQNALQSFTAKESDSAEADEEIEAPEVDDVVVRRDDASVPTVKTPGVSARDLLDADPVERMMTAARLSVGGTTVITPPTQYPQGNNAANTRRRLA